MFRRIYFLLFLVASLLPLGCGGKTKDGDDSKDGTDKANLDGKTGNGVTANDRRSGNSVTGTVTFDGKPVAGVVIFVGADNKEQGTAPATEDGRYFIESAPPGKYTVVVRPMLGTPAPLGGAPKAELPDPPTGTAGTKLPAKYANPKTSGITFEVTKGEQTFDIPLMP